MSDDPGEQARAAQVILALLAARGPDKSICPSEAARALAGEAAGEAWRGQLGLVRRVALRLAAEGRIDVLRKGKPVATADVKGVIRLRIKALDGCEVAE